ncbi:MAG: TonB-dependent receptor [Sphingomonadales bacterium]|nr:TonB-dependent receptor [Sphingomonadales bacterium]
MSISYKNVLRTALLGSSAVVMAGASFGANTAFAQDEDENIEQVIVTGSRIARKDLSAPSPVAVVSGDEFRLQGTPNVEQVLNTLPQTVPGFGGSSNNPGNGTATVDLRGLGASRTMVLVNGRRYLQSSQSGIVDLNTIPAALVERVEVVTGGASAVYGSDALGGVVNFVLRDDFEGVELSGQYDLSTRGDADRYTMDMTIGGNFADGKGNAVLNIGYMKRTSLFQGDRKFSTLALGDCSTTDAFDNDFGTGEVSNGLGYCKSGSSGIPSTRLFGPPTMDPLGDDVWGLSAADDLHNNGTPDDLTDDFQYMQLLSGGDDNWNVHTWNQDGTGAGTWDRYNYAPVNYLQLPQERYMITGAAHYEINEKIRLSARGTFASNRVNQELAPTPAFLGTVDVNVNSPYFNGLVGTTGPDGIQGPVVYHTDAGADGIMGTADDKEYSYNDDTGMTALDPDGDGIAQLPFIGRRMLENGNRQAKNTRDAFQIMLGADGDLGNGWNYSAYYSMSQVDYSELLNNDVAESRFRQAVLVSDDGLSCQDTSNGCAPLNVFGAGNISDEAIAFINVGAANVTFIQQQVAQATVNGALGDFTGAGETGVSFGVEWRKDTSDARPDEFLSAGDVLGFNAGKPTAGDFDVKEIFGEIVVPLMEGLEASGAARYSDYSNVGGVWSYAGGVTWAPIDDIKFRAQYQRAVRAPNVAELFQGEANGFPGASDPCAVQLNGDLPDPSLQALCVATGVAAADFGVFEQANGQIEGIFGGNPDLSEETSDTYTLGMVIEPSAIPGLDITVDYYDITIDDTISVLGGGLNNVLNICYNIIKDANDQYCQAIDRRSDGNIDTVSLRNANIGKLETRGVDIQANYTTELGFGMMSEASTLDLFFQGTYLDQYRITPVVALGDTITCAGDFGYCGEPMPTWRHNVRATLTDGDLSLSAFWRYIGSSTIGEIANEGTTKADYAAATLKAVNYFDLTATYDLNENLTLSIGSTNLFDKKPQFLGDWQEQANTYPSTYDAIGRRVFFNATAKF